MIDTIRFILCAALTLSGLFVVLSGVVGGTPKGCFPTAC